MIEVEHWDSASDGVLSEQALRDKLISRGFSVTRYVYPPDTRFPPHSHDCDKFDAVLSGQFRLSMGGVSVILHAGDCLYVPKGIIHSAEVIGDDEVISLDGVRT
ncbi:MAG: cupin domain-containing protein [Gammaproteobacteria bacterium]